MIDGNRKRELSREYKEKKAIGCIYKITNTENNKYYLGASANKDSTINRYEFSQSMGSCILPHLQDDWKAYGAKAFVLDILDEAEIKDGQTQKEFIDDLNVLCEIWSEKFNKADRY